MRKLLFVASMALFIIFTSCQKEISGDFLNTATPNDLTGTWKFLNSTVSTTSTVEVKDQFADVKNITLSDYVTVNNQGSLLINDSLMVTSGVAYDISTIARAFTYVDGNIEDSTDFPFSLFLSFHQFIERLQTHRHRFDLCSRQFTDAGGRRHRNAVCTQWL